MAVYLFQETEPFALIAERLRSQGTDLYAQSLVRRPTRGIQISRNTYAYLKVVDRGNNTIPMINSSSDTWDESGRGYAPSTANFLLQEVQIARAEMKQFVKTFGLNYLFLFGENPVMLTVRGALLHSEDFRWDEEWWVNYENTLRATELAAREARVYLCYEGVMIEGYPLNATTRRSAEDRHNIPLAFEMVATNIKYLAKVGSTDFPITGTIFDASRPTTFGGRDINSVLPVNQQLSVDTSTATAFISSGPSFTYGSMRDLINFVTASPELLIGNAVGTVSNVAQLGLDELARTKYKLPDPVFGKFVHSRDEYVAGIPMAHQSSPQDRVQRFMGAELSDNDPMRAGEALRPQLSGPTDSYPNFSNVEGVGRDSGIGVLPDQELPVTATSPTTSPSSLRPWPGEPAP